MKWEPDKYAADGQGPARDPTPDESAGVKALGPHAATVAGLYADVDPAPKRGGPKDARTYFCRRKLDDGRLCGARFEAFAYAAFYCPPCRKLMQVKWKTRHEDKVKP